MRRSRITPTRSGGKIECAVMTMSWRSAKSRFCAPWATL
jgi:hypothetical protein